MSKIKTTYKPALSDCFITKQREQMEKHSQVEDCSKFLEENNLFTEGTKKKIERFVRTVERGCFDEFLVLFARYSSCSL